MFEPDFPGYRPLTRDELVKRIDAKTPEEIAILLSATWHGDKIHLEEGDLLGAVDIETARLLVLRDYRFKRRMHGYTIDDVAQVLAAALDPENRTEATPDGLSSEVVEFLLEQIRGLQAPGIYKRTTIARNLPVIPGKMDS